MSIHCWGRRYPNAPLWYFTGAVARLPPHWMMPNLGGFTGPAASMNGFKVLGASGIIVPTVWDPSLTWGPFTPQVFPLFNASMELDRNAEKWTMYLFVQTDQTPDGGHIEFKRWKRTQPDGWDWGSMTTFDMAIDFTSPGWLWGGADAQSVFLGTYGLLPPNSCIGV